MLRSISLALALAAAPLAASAAIYNEPTPNLVPGGIVVTPAPGSSIPADSTPYVGSIFGGEGFVMSGMENFAITLANPAETFTQLEFEIYEPTSSAKLEGCNTVCVQSTFKLEAFLNGSSVANATFRPIPDSITTLYFGVLFDTLRVTEIVGSDDNEFFGNFRAETISAVPLPAGGLLLAGALAGIAGLRRRKSA